MSFLINLETYEPGKDYLLISYEGEVNLDVIKLFAPRIILAIKHRDCYRLLEDYRKTIFNKDATTITSMQAFQMENLINNGIPYSQVKRALMVDENQVSIQEMGFFESLSINKGQQVKVFYDMYKAIKWLNSD
jgi:hypothetical protein